jgi:hypothetical protein
MVCPRNQEEGRRIQSNRAHRGAAKQGLPVLHRGGRDAKLVAIAGIRHNHTTEARAKQDIR